MVNFRTHIILSALLACGCTQLVQVKVKQQATELRLDRVAVDPNQKCAVVELPTGFGPVPYELRQDGALKTRGLLRRTELDPWIAGTSIGGAILAAPALAVLGVFVANPLWLIAPFVVNGGPGAQDAFRAQTMSFWTVPIATLFGVIGLTPLLGLLKAERLPTTVDIP